SLLMHMKMKNTFKISIFLIVILAASRFFPHAPNATPILALSLFGGATIANKRVAFLIVLSAMILSDLLIGLHSTILFVYPSIILLVLQGSYFLDIEKTSSKLVNSISGSLLFFLITNFGVWLI